MKKLVFIIFLLSIASHLIAQNVPIYPIPSTCVSVNGYVAFQPTGSNKMNTKIKKDVNVRISSSSVLPGTCQATVWIYTLDHSTILGPYYVTCGETLTVPIDQQQWGVLVESQYKVSVDVWYSE